MEDKDEIVENPRRAWPGHYRLACAVLAKACQDVERGDKSARAFLLRETCWHQLVGAEPFDFIEPLRQIAAGKLSPLHLSITGETSLADARARQMEYLDPYLEEWFEERKKDGRA